MSDKCLVCGDSMTENAPRVCVVCFVCPLCGNNCDYYLKPSPHDESTEARCEECGVRFRGVMDIEAAYTRDWGKTVAENMRVIGDRDRNET